MRKILMKKIPYVLAAGAAIAVLAGCSSPSTPPTASGSASASASASPTEGGTGQESPATTPQPTVAPVEGRCTSDELAPSIQGSTEDTGTTTIAIALTNVSTTASCTLQGWPGVSFVHGGNGTQLGAAAEQNRDSAHETVTLNADGGSATFTVTILPYSNEECQPQDADGIRIYPPGETRALFIDGAGQNLVGCASESATLLTTNAMQPGS